MKKSIKTILRGFTQADAFLQNLKQLCCNMLFYY